MRTRLITAAAGAATAALALTACGSSSTGESLAVQQAAVGSGVIIAAAETAQDAGSARITGSITTTGAPIDIGEVTIEGVQTFDPEGLDLTLRTNIFGQGQQLRAILLDGAAYAQVPMLGGQWFTADLSGIAAANPFAAEDWSDVVDIRQTGTGTVEGMQVTFYEGSLDLTAALAKADLPAEKLAELPVDTTDPGSATVAFAVDTDGRLVQWNSVVTVNTDAQPLTISADLRWYDFGVDTDIAAPPADQVADLEGLLPGGFGGFGDGMSLDGLLGQAAGA